MWQTFNMYTHITVQLKQEWFLNDKIIVKIFASVTFIKQNVSTYCKYKIKFIEQSSLTKEF